MVSRSAVTFLSLCQNQVHRRPQPNFSELFYRSGIAPIKAAMPIFRKVKKYYRSAQPTGNAYNYVAYTYIGQ